MADLSAYTTPLLSTGGDGTLDKVTDFMKGQIVWVLALLVILIILIVYLVFTRKESMNTGGSVVRLQDSDQFGLSLNDRAKTPSGYAVSAGEAFDGPGQGKGQEPQPGTPSYVVLNSPEYGCNGRTNWEGDDAWAWQSQVAASKTESMSDNELSKGLVSGTVNPMY